MFSCEICEIFKNFYFEEHLQTTAFVPRYESYHRKYRVTSIFIKIVRYTRQFLDIAII